MPRPKRAKIASSQSAAPLSNRPTERTALKESTASRVNTVGRAKNSTSVKPIKSQIDGADEENDVEDTESQAQEVERLEKVQASRNVKKTVRNDQAVQSRHNTQNTSSASKSSKSAEPTPRTDDLVVTRSRRSSTRQSQNEEDRDTDLRPNDDSLELSFDTALEEISPEPSPQRVPNTPSMLSIANFKRRPRQPSILRMVQLSAQKPTYNADQPDEEEEGTSLQSVEGYVSSPPTDTNPQLQSAISSKRKSTSDENVLPPRKRKSLEHFSNLDLDCEEGQIHDTSPAAKTSTPSSNLPVRRARSSARTNLESAKSSKRRTSHRIPGNIVEDPETPLPTTRRVSSRKQRQQRFPPPILADSDAASPVSSSPEPDPSLNQEVPDNSNNRQARARADEPRITTASLQALLPKTHRKLIKRNQPTNEHSSDVSSDESEEDPSDDDFDEFQGSKRTRKRRAPPKSSTAAKSAAKPRRNQASKTESLAKNPANIDSVVQSPQAIKKRKNQRTYGSNSASALGLGQDDRERDEDTSAQADGHTTDDDDNAEDEVESSMLEASKSKELVSAVKKFESVDEWELEFESCDIGGEDSSPWR